MSLGWSAGDIPSAIKLVYDLIEALDSCDGAAGDYREAVSFLRDLKRTLDPLQTFTAWRTYPRYGEEISEQVGKIKEPLDHFIQEVMKYEPSLGKKAAKGHHRHIGRKLQWHPSMTKRVLFLRTNNQLHMRIIVTLLQRLTLLRGKHPTAPVSGLRENLVPFDIDHATIEALLETRHQLLMPNLSSNYQDLSSGIYDIKAQIPDTRLIKHRVFAPLKEPTSVRQEITAGRRAKPTFEKSTTRYSCISVTS